MSAQPKNVPGAGTTERQEDWTITSLLKDLSETGSLSRRKKANFRQYVERYLDRLGSFAYHDIPHQAPAYVCEAFGAPEGSFWIQICCHQLDEMGVAHPDAEEGDDEGADGLDEEDDDVWSVAPHPPNITLKNDLFIPLHII